MKSSVDFDSYFSQFPVKSYRKKWNIVNAGDTVQKIFYLKKGYVRVYAMSSDGKELTLLIYKPGSFFPILTALKHNITYPYWIETITPADVVAVPVQSFITFFKDNPELLLNMSMEIMQRLDSALKRMEYLVFGSVYVRIASILLMLSQQFGKKEGSSIVIEVALTHKEIGYLIGAVRETVSAEIKKLEEKGIIEQSSKKIIIKNTKALEKEALIEESY